MDSFHVRSILLRTSIVLAGLLLASGLAAAGPPPGVCICIEVGGHCISFC